MRNTVEAIPVAFKPAMAEARVHVLRVAVNARGRDASIWARAWKPPSRFTASCCPRWKSDEAASEDTDAQASIRH